MSHILHMYDDKLINVSRYLKELVHREPFIIGNRKGKKFDHHIRDKVHRWSVRSGIPYQIEIKRVADWLIGCWQYIPLENPIAEAEHYRQKQLFDKNLHLCLKWLEVEQEIKGPEKKDTDK